MIQKIWNELNEHNEVRKNLSSLREMIKKEENRKISLGLAEKYRELLKQLLENEDAKVRKNTALLIGDLGLVSFQDALWTAYKNEKTLFVRGSYLAALQNMDMTAYSELLKEQMCRLQEAEVTQNDKKHIREEMQSLNRLIMSVEGSQEHKFTGWQKESDIILLANRRHLDRVLEEIGQQPDIAVSNAKLMNAGIRMKTSALEPLMKIRTWQEMLFLVNGMKTCEKDPQKAAETIASSNLIEFLEKRHDKNAPFRFRAEVKVQISNQGKNACERREQEKAALEKKNKFMKRFVSELEEKTSFKLVNSPSDYELEIRMVENKEGRFNVMVKLFTLQDRRFLYRQETVASSIRPVNAALLVQLAKAYMQENARVLDPFCGVGTMLIERGKKISADTSYGVDIFEKAIDKARINAQAAGQLIHFINRDCFTFTHQYPFDEIFTNMPFVQGRKTEPEIYEIYEKFFKYAKGLVRVGGVIILYTHNKIYVERLALREAYTIEEKYQINVKEDTWLYILRVQHS